MDCGAVRENIDAWALGALDGDDARELEHHLETCAACSILAAAAREDAASITLAVPLRSAPPALKARVMSAAGVLTDIGRARSRRRYWMAAAAAAVVLGVGVAGWNAYLQSRVSSLGDDNRRVSADATSQSSQFATMRTELVQASVQNAELGASQDAVVEIMSQPDVQRVALSGTSAAPSASGRYIWTRSGGLGALVARNLPPLAEGETYYMWVVYERASVSGGLFGVDGSGTGRLIVRDLDGNDGDRGKFLGFAVTVEPSSPAAPASRRGPTLLQSPPD